MRSDNSVGPFGETALTMHRWPTECRSAAGALFATHTGLPFHSAYWSFLLREQSKHYEAAIQTARISCYLKDNATRSVLINWSGHQTKHAQKAWQCNWWANLLLSTSKRAWIKTYHLAMMSKAAEMRGEWLQHVQYATQIQKHTYCSAVNYQGAAANVCVY